MVVIYEYCDHCFTDCPAVKALKARKAYWIPRDEEGYECSNCHIIQEDCTLYCSECGGEMSNGEARKKF